jgi:hypothetical protein
VFTSREHSHAIFLEDDMVCSAARLPACRCVHGARERTHYTHNAHTRKRARTRLNARAHARQVFSPDFLTLFEATAYLLDDDPTIWSARRSTAQRSTALRSTALRSAERCPALPCT